MPVAALADIHGNVHTLPDDDARYVTPLTPEADFAADLDGIVEPTVIGGHTHVRMDRRIGRWRYVNVGADRRDAPRPADGRGSRGLR
jgi:hypothetical protein